MAKTPTRQARHAPTRGFPDKNVWPASQPQQGSSVQANGMVAEARAPLCASSGRRSAEQISPWLPPANKFP